ncbi:histidine kinase [Tenacibaculum sp. FZY0031]|uniref:sensor histidine kinase n=1 Tax=Tenacibaculum sp. FZY0031 TaxID=3116648 RepID=UPI002EB40D04|nr:histidine kinase [Tenacibaculum sp. FZY0031]
MRQLHDKAYRAQMNPHFIFNVINNIQSVLFLKGEEVVNEYISSFSRLLRITLQNSDRERITLKEEIEYLKTYLKLTELKNEIKINVIFNIDEELLIDTVRIPPMLFQPIVENAIIHGLKNKKGEKKIEINFKQTNNILLGVIKDNGIGIEAAKKIATKGKYRSYGNKILNERIKILNEMHTLKIVLKVREKRTKGTEVVLMIPLYKKTPRKHQKNK